MDFHDIELGDGFLDMAPKAQGIKEKETDKLDFISIKNIFTSKDTIKKVKRKPCSGRKYLQIIYLIRDLYMEYIKIIYNSKINRQITQF